MRSKDSALSQADASQTELARLQQHLTSTEQQLRQQVKHLQAQLQDAERNAAAAEQASSSSAQTSSNAAADTAAAHARLRQMSDLARQLNGAVGLFEQAMRACSHGPRVEALEALVLRAVSAPVEPAGIGLQGLGRPGSSSNGVQGCREQACGRRAKAGSWEQELAVEQHVQGLQAQLREAEARAEGLQATLAAAQGQLAERATHAEELQGQVGASLCGAQKAKIWDGESSE